MMLPGRLCVSKKYLGLCPLKFPRKSFGGFAPKTPILRCFFEKKHLKRVSKPLWRCPKARRSVSYFISALSSSKRSFSSVISWDSSVISSTVAVIAASMSSVTVSLRGRRVT